MDLFEHPVVRPDIILVGEIRDLEDLRTIQVLAHRDTRRSGTSHTNDAAGCLHAISFDMGLELFLVFQHGPGRHDSGGPGFAPASARRDHRRQADESAR